jgi:hypothetical protein
MAKTKIVITDELVTDALSSGRTISEVLSKHYEGEIADRITADSRLRDMDPIQMSMMDFGIGKRSLVKDFYQTTGSEWLFPAFVDRRLRESVQGMNILPYIAPNIAGTSSMAVQGAKLTMDDANTEATKQKRVAEGSDIPLAILKLSDVAITLKKRGRAVQATYETIMFQSLDMFARHLDMIANDVSGQQVGDAISVLVNGDGNTNPAEVSTIAGDSGLTAEELAGFAIEFWKGANVPVDTLVCGDGDFFKKLMLMNFKADDVNGLLAGATFNFPQAMLTNLTVLYDPRVPKGTSSKEQLIGLNRQYALTKWVANGSQIREIDKNIRNQTHLGTISEIAGFEKFNDKATRILKAK